PIVGPRNAPSPGRTTDRAWCGPGPGLETQLLAVVPNVGRELPVSADLLPHHDIFAGDFLRIGTLGLQAEGPDLARRGSAQRLDVEGRHLRIADLLGHALPQRRDGGSAFDH